MRMRTTGEKLTVCAMLALAVVPLLKGVAGGDFILDIATRVAIMGLAATSLNWLVGYSGLVSLGHAASIGLGAYSVAIADFYGVNNGLVHLGWALLSGGVFALLTGVVSLRTRGVAFIMMTMAFGQMAYYALVSMATYGGDDGLVIYARSDFTALGIDLENDTVLFYVAWVLLVASILLTHRVARARFGQLLMAARQNEKRAIMLGFPVWRYQLFVMVATGMAGSVAGVLLANFTLYISPDMMGWSRSASCC